MLYRSDDLQRFFPAAYLARGRYYQRHGRVLAFSVRQQGQLITGRVSGSRDMPYEVEIRLNADGSKLREIESHCSCPVGFNCKHGAAVLLEALVRGDRSMAGPVDRSTTVRAEAPHLSQETQGWLNRLRQVASQRDSEYPETVRDRLLYILKPSRWDRGGVGIAVVKVRLLKDGGYGSASHYGLYGALFGHRAQFVTDTDVALIQDLQRIDPSGERLRGPEGARLLPRLLATGRCHWESAADPPLTEGESRQATLDWQINDQGYCQLSLVTEPQARVLPLSPPWYLDPQHHGCGPIQSSLPTGLATELASGPVLKPDELPLVQEWLSNHLADQPLPPPPNLVVEEVADVQPTPNLYLYTRQRGTAGASEATDAVDGARLSFDYQGKQVFPNETLDRFDRYHEGKLYRIHRDRQREMAYIRQLVELGMDSLTVFFPEHRLQQDMLDDLGFEDSEAWVEFILDTVPLLRRQGWQINCSAKFRFNLASPGDWYLDLHDRGMDWFSMALGVEIDGQQVNLLPALAQYLQQRSEDGDHSWIQELDENSKLMLPLADGRLLALPAGRVKGILQTLVELYDTPLSSEGHLSLPRIQALRLEELQRALGDTPLRWQGGESLRELAAKLRAPLPAPGPPPPGLHAELRDYQKHGVQWLQFLGERDLGGILADDMGLGKTLQALAHVLREKHAGRLAHPCLVVAPTSLMANWRNEAGRFTPDLRVLVLQGPKRQARFGAIPEHDLVLTTYPLLPRDQKALLAHEYSLVVLDEAQSIKNPRSQAGTVARALRTRQRLCLTGTPLENHLGELWSLFDFLLPGLLGDQDQFRRLFRRPIEQFEDAERQAHLARRIAPFMLRRRKEQVAAELPPKTEMDRAASLSGKQRDLYESIRFAMQKKVREAVRRQGMSRSTLTILEALLRLRQVCCDPRLVKLESARGVKQSAKLDLLLGLLPDMVAEGRRILLFSQFTGMLALIQQELERRKLDFVKLTGQTRDRETPVQRFQAGEVPLFLISLKAGGTGLNLTAADTVIHYDPWWNPAVEEQATDRAHRIGQDKPVFVYRLYTEGTVEAKMQELKARKQALTEGVLGEGGGSLSGWDQTDLEFLLAPLE